MGFLFGLAVVAGGIAGLVVLYVLWWYLFSYSKVVVTVSTEAPEDFKVCPITSPLTPPLPTENTHSHAINNQQETLRNCKVLLGGWKPTMVAPGMATQTLGVAVKRTRPFVTCNRELLRLADGGQVGLDWFPMSSNDRARYARQVRDLQRQGVAVPAPAASEEERPIVVVCHGLNGGSNENYIRHFARALQQDPRLRGCRVVVMVARGLGGVPMLTPTPYNAGSTDDVRAAIAHLHARYPRAPLLLAGFSLGANVACRYVCEERGRTPVAAVLAVNCPFDLHASIVNLETRQGAVGRYFSANMAKGLARYTRKNAEALRKSPYRVDLRAACAARLCSEFDEAGSSKMFGLAHNTDYYREYSALPVLREHAAAVTTPTLFLAAANDCMCAPEVRAEVQDIVRRAGPAARIALATSQNGGHLGFLEATGVHDACSWQHSWMDRVGREWFANALNSYVPLEQEQQQQ